MPCNDITESLELTLDYAEQVAYFSLNKRTCGQTVGGDALLPFVRGRAASDVESGFLEQFVSELDAYGEVDEFLLQKQFFALQAAIAVYHGRTSGERDQIFTLASVTYDEARTTIEGEIAIDALVEKISACKGCGTSKGERVLRQTDAEPDAA